MTLVRHFVEDGSAEHSKQHVTQNGTNKLNHSFFRVAPPMFHGDATAKAVEARNNDRGKEREQRAEARPENKREEATTREEESRESSCYGDIATMMTIESDRKKPCRISC